MRIFALIPALAAFVAAVAGAAVEVDAGCVLGIGLGGFETCIALSTAPPDIESWHTGSIEVLDSDNKHLGCISNNLDKYGQLIYDTSAENAIIVSFKTTSTGSSTKLDLTATDSGLPYPFLGLVQGYDDIDSDLKPNSWQYLYIGSISAPGTQPGATPSTIDNSVEDATGKNRTAETAVWKYDNTSSLLTPQWINTDLSSPIEDLFAGEKDAVLYVGASMAAFQAKFPGTPVAPIKFRFLEA